MFINYLLSIKDHGEYHKYMIQSWGARQWGVMSKIKEYEGMGKIKGHRRATQGREDKGGMVGGTGKIKGHDMRMGMAFEMSLEGWV